MKVTDRGYIVFLAIVVAVFFSSIRYILPWLANLA